MHGAPSAPNPKGLLVPMKTALEANRRYFREAYASGDHGWEAQEPSAYAMDFLKSLKRLVPGARLLDVGCGEGRHSIAAARLGFKVTGVDFEPLALKRARRLAGAAWSRRITFMRANVLRLPFPKSSFDIVLDYGCLHHQKKSDWPAYKAAILRVLAPGGFFVLSAFSREFPLFRGSRRPWHIAYGAYRRSFTRREISDLFGRDFEIMKIVKEKGRHEGFWHVLMMRRAGPA